MGKKFLSLMFFFFKNNELNLGKFVFLVKIDIVLCYYRFFILFDR